MVINPDLHDLICNSLRQSPHDFLSNVFRRAELFHGETRTMHLCGELHNVRFLVSDLNETGAQKRENEHESVSSSCPFIFDQCVSNVIISEEMENREPIASTVPRQS